MGGRQKKEEGKEEQKPGRTEQYRAAGRQGELQLGKPKKKWGAKKSGGFSSQNRLGLTIRSYALYASDRTTNCAPSSNGAKATITERQTTPRAVLYPAAL